MVAATEVIASRRNAIEIRKCSLVLLCIALGVVVFGAGCGTVATGGRGGTSTSAQSAAGVAAARNADQAVYELEQSLARFVGIDPADIAVSDATPTSPIADTVIEWSGGKAEFDSRTAVVYAASAGRSTPVGAQPLTLERLQFEANGMVAALGWTGGILEGLGLRQQGIGTVGESGVYTVSWAQYDAEGTPRDGLIVLTLDGATAALVSFSARPGSDVPGIAGAISDAQALQIAQTQIYLRTDKPKLTLAGDGSIIMLNRRVTEELKVIDDSKIVSDEPRLCWVLTVLGTVGTEIVGGTVYLDSATGEVLKYEAYESSEPVTTSTTGP